MKRTVISECGKYRYTLSRKSTLECPCGSTVLFIMLNPSTADADLDDATIRRCKTFAHDWDCNGLVVANLYAFRATKPKDLWRAEDPVGPENDDWLNRLANEFKDVVCAWGANAKDDRVKHVVEIFKSKGCRLFHLGLTKAGQPKHPLFIKASQPLVEWKV